MTNVFEELGLQSLLGQTLVERGYEQPTPIQREVIPLMLAGRDVIGQAQTGTGKTAAFSLPILQNLKAERYHVQALVVTPTRELAIQVTGAIYEYGRRVKLDVLAVYGGQHYRPQIQGLKDGVDIVVGTPGRLLDLIKRKALDLSLVNTVIIDEADEMLSMGFIEDVEALLKSTPDGRQTALFSATMPNEVRRLANNYMKEPETIIIPHKQLTVETIEQRYYLVKQKDKTAALARFFEVEEITSALIFTRTRLGSGGLANQLVRRGIMAEALNGDLNQDARERVLDRFRSGGINVLVATDVAARGLDIEGISHVFNYDLPSDPEVYVHRIGRTGRAGKSGTAISFVCPGEERRLQQIERLARHRIDQAVLPSVADIQNHREKQLLQKVTVWLQRDRAQRERQMAAELVEAGYDPLDIAAAALKVARSQEKQRPIPEISELKLTPDWDSQPPRRLRNRKGDGRRANDYPSKRRGSNGSHEVGMVRLTLNRGKSHGLRPNELVRTIATHADIPGNVIGRIDIYKKYTLVDVPDEYVEKVIANADRYRIRKQSVSLQRS